MVVFQVPLVLVLCCGFFYLRHIGYDSTPRLGESTVGWRISEVAAWVVLPLMLALVGWRALQAFRILGVLYVRPLPGGVVAIAPPVLTWRKRGALVTAGSRVSLTSSTAGQDKRLRGFGYLGFPFSSWRLSVDGKVVASFSMPFATSKSAKTNLRDAVDQARAASALLSPT